MYHNHLQVPVHQLQIQHPIQVAEVYVMIMGEFLLRIPIITPTNKLVYRIQTWYMEYILPQGHIVGSQTKRMPNIVTIHQLRYQCFMFLNGSLNYIPNDFYDETVTIKEQDVSPTLGNAEWSINPSKVICAAQQYMQPNTSNVDIATNYTPQMEYNSMNYIPNNFYDETVTIKEQDVSPTLGNAECSINPSKVICAAQQYMQPNTSNVDIATNYTPQMEYNSMNYIPNNFYDETVTIKEQDVSPTLGNAEWSINPSKVICAAQQYMQPNTSNVDIATNYTPQMEYNSMNYIPNNFYDETVTIKEQDVSPT
ncbi:hypothetical protein HHI36_023965 [Cryptolaemus montrouzieri]|uniref:Uncharacterized protein n=1 Tax=Cryptolaemus montrouzieri TaxID=559131 RepID=A0ABD2NZ88_9CUCU